MFFWVEFDVYLASSGPKSAHVAFSWRKMHCAVFLTRETLDLVWGGLQNLTLGPFGWDNSCNGVCRTDGAMEP